MIKSNVYKSITASRVLSKEFSSVLDYTLDVEYEDDGYPDINAGDMCAMLTESPAVITADGHFPPEACHEAGCAYTGMLQKIRDDKKEFALTGKEKFFLDIATALYVKDNGDDTGDGTEKEKDKLLHECGEALRKGNPDSTKEKTSKEAEARLRCLFRPSCFIEGGECAGIISCRGTVPKRWNPYTGTFYKDDECKIPVHDSEMTGKQ